MRMIILGSACAAALGMAHPAAAETFGDVARVISSTPIQEQVFQPRRECRTEQASGYQERREYVPARPASSGAGAVLGAIVGGVIGHQIDHGAGTAAGAVIGSIVGDSAERDSGYERASREVLVERTPVTREVQRCRDVPQARERIVAYDVRYEYNGREFRTRLPYDPGQELPVNVDVRPPGETFPHRGPMPRYRTF